MNLRTLRLAIVAGALLAPATLTFAQAEPGNNGGNRERREGGRGNFDPAEMRARFEARFKEQLGVNDEEWKVLQPRIEKVTNAQRDARGGGGGGRGRGGDRGGSDQPQSAVSKASGELRTTLENKEAPAEEINAKLTALREARAKARTDLENAQKELKEVLTARQEAALVSMGMLD